MKERIVPQKRTNKTPTTKARPTKRNGRAAKSAHTPGNTSSFTRVRPTTRKKGAFSRPAQTRSSAHAAPEGRFSPEVLLTRRNLLIGAGVIGGIAAVGGISSAASSAFRPIRRSRAFRSPKMPLPSWLISPKCPMAIIGGFRHLRTYPSAVLFGQTTTPSQPACARPRAHTRSTPSVSTISDRQTWQKS